MMLWWFVFCLILVARRNLDNGIYWWNLVKQRVIQILSLVSTSYIQKCTEISRWMPTQFWYPTRIVPLSVSMVLLSENVDKSLPTSHFLFPTNTLLRLNPYSCAERREIGFAALEFDLCKNPYASVELLYLCLLTVNKILAWVKIN